MKRRTGVVVSVFLLVALAVVVGRVAAAAETAADPQPGFGVMLAAVAILIARVIAHRKQEHYEQG